jgi:protein-S-isoprenylcysteine O-methyltransferase Ste14
MPDWIFRVVLPLLWIWLIAGLSLNRFLVGRRIGRDPIVIQPTQPARSANAFLEKSLLVCGLLATLDVLWNALSPRTAADRIGIALLRESRAVGLAGLGLLAAGVAVASMAVRQMGVSWRMGIDRQGPGALVSTGLFGRVRHPIYTGSLLATAGLAAVTADMLSLAVAVSAFVGLPVQARLEEEFLSSRYPDQYPDYLRRTGRFWPRRGGGSS